MASISYKNSGDVYTCKICCKKFQCAHNLYYCNYGHFFCKKCYNQHQKEGEVTCPHPFCTSHLREMDDVISTKTSASGSRKGKKMFSVENAIPEVTYTSNTTYKTSTLFRDCSTAMSKKPVNCPYPGCKKTIAVSAVDSHFKYEHKIVPFLKASYEVRTMLQLNPFGLEINHPTCIVLIRIMDDKLSINPVMLVMASNITSSEINHHYAEDGELSDETNSYNFYPFDNIIFWVGSNIITQCKCTLAVSTICKTIRVKYYGPISQINDSCLKLCDEGKGLILHQMQILNMTNNGKTPLALDVILHQDNV